MIARGASKAFRVAIRPLCSMKAITRTTPRFFSVDLKRSNEFGFNNLGRNNLEKILAQEIEYEKDNYVPDESLEVKNYF